MEAGKTREERIQVCRHRAPFGCGHSSGTTPAIGADAPAVQWAQPYPEPGGKRVDALDLMLARRSVRRFTTQDISLEDEQKLIDAAFAAPSGNNARPWHFVFVRDPVTRARLKGMHEWTWMLDKAPLVVAVLGNDKDNPWWIEDCAAAAENILLEATALGPVSYTHL